MALASFESFILSKATAAVMSAVLVPHFVEGGVPFMDASTLSIIAPSLSSLLQKEDNSFL